MNRSRPGPRISCNAAGTGSASIPSGPPPSPSAPSWGLSCSAALDYHFQLKREMAQTEVQREQVAAEKAEAMQRLVRLTVANGVQHLNDDDLLGSLPWFAEALKLEAGSGERAEMHRIRLAAVLRQSPRLVRACASTMAACATPNSAPTGACSSAAATMGWPPSRRWKPAAKQSWRSRAATSCGWRSTAPASNFLRSAKTTRFLFGTVPRANCSATRCRTATT